MGQYLARIAAGEKPIGRVPAEVEVAVAEQRLATMIAASQAKHARRAAVEARPAGQRRAGRPPMPVEQNARPRQARARLQQARAAAEAAQVKAEAEPVEHMANIPDPQSRIQPLRGGRWLQGYNCQAVTAADGLIMANDVGNSPVDNQYYRDMVDKAVTAAELITRHRPPNPSGQAAESIGIVLSDAGYCTRENLTGPGPDRVDRHRQSPLPTCRCHRKPDHGPTAR